MVTSCCEASFVSFDLSSSSLFAAKDYFVAKQVINFYVFWVNEVVNILSFDIVQLTADGTDPSVLFRASERSS